MIIIKYIYIIFDDLLGYIINNTWDRGKEIGKEREEKRGREKERMGSLVGFWFLIDKKKIERRNNNNIFILFLFYFEREKRKKKCCYYYLTIYILSLFSLIPIIYIYIYKINRFCHIEEIVDDSLIFKLII